MKILIINPPHTSIGSRIPKEHLTPLGLLAIGGPLIDAGHEVKLLDADYCNSSAEEIIEDAKSENPEAILMGHSGSNTAQPIINELSTKLRMALPQSKIIVGGVFPTYFWKQILENVPAIDYLVIGEGELTTINLINVLEEKSDISKVKGIAHKKDGEICRNEDQELIQNLDDYRIGWELIDLDKYKYWGDRKAVVMQFSRGCPHMCSYCGQNRFWKKWRHRDPKKFAKEIAYLHKEHGVEVINFADENPNVDKKAWQEFLEALIAEDLPDLILVGSIRADGIVRDKDILHLYKKAGFERFLLGIENYNPERLLQIKKGNSIAKDKEAIKLLKSHGIIAMATYIMGLGDETDKDYLFGLKQLLKYDPDQIQTLYATPHPWTPYYKEVAGREVIQPNFKKWDYKHQVIKTNIPTWRVFMWVKFIEVVMQSRPKAIWRFLTYHPRSAMKWYYSVGRKVWFHEIADFLFRDKRVKKGPTVEEYFEGLFVGGR